MALRLPWTMPEWSDQEFLRTVFEETRVIRTPLRGIIAGYHVLPYVLLGPAEYDRTSKTVEVRGRIRVSPRLVLGGNAPTYGEMFGERDLMDARIVARVFSFRYAGRLSLEGEDLAIRRHEGDLHQGDLRRLRARQVEALGAVGGRVHLVTVELEQRTQGLAGVGVVLDEQHASHDFTLSRRPSDGPRLDSTNERMVFTRAHLPLQEAPQ